MDRFRRKIKDQQFLWLLSVIIFEQPGKGLPLGAFTSGWFCNFYLNPIDHFLKQELKVQFIIQVYEICCPGNREEQKELHKLRKVNEKLVIGLETLKATLAGIPVDGKETIFLGFKTEERQNDVLKEIWNGVARFVKKMEDSRTQGQASALERAGGDVSQICFQTYVS